MPDSWNPAQYNRFQREREQPFRDLLSLVRPAPGLRIIDLGCGTGRFTRLLHETLAASETVGIDRSERMLEPARAAPLPAGLRFRVETIEAFLETGAVHDLIVSNAVFHWVEDHETLLARLVRKLSPRGQLAFQVPAMHDNPAHLVADELGREEPFRSALQGWRRAQPVLAPEEYARQLYRLGFADPQVRLIVYPHVLTDRDDVIEWMKGTLLSAYETRMPPELYVRFVDAYRTRLMPRFEDARPFFFPFKRLLCWGQRA